ncbi:MAG: hypothetical protein WKG07_29895 [Hymenobacter sp.]
MRWGAKIGRESIHDQLDEYSFADSADYVPDARRRRLVADLSLLTTRNQGYVQHTWQIDSLTTLTYGLRGHYWTENQQFVLSPRAQFATRSRRHPERAWKARRRPLRPAALLPRAARHARPAQFRAAGPEIAAFRAGPRNPGAPDEPALPAQYRSLL